MPVYLSPGVYVEEVPGTPPIVGVGTSTAGFIGVVDDTKKGPPPGSPPGSPPEGKPFTMPFKPGRPLDPANIVGDDRFIIAPAGVPQLITSFEQFKIKFGDFQAGNSTLAHAVFGFFNNGGTTCYVARVASIAEGDLGAADGVGASLKKFEAIDEIAIVAVPGALDDGTQAAVIAHCENMKDRFAIIDGQQITSFGSNPVEEVKGPVGNSDYAALYFPWLQVIDPITKTTIFVPPSGHMAGIYTRVDASRGVHKAPANEVVRGALGLQYLVTKNEQDNLNPKGINVIRNLNGNIRVWGARTLGGDLNEANGQVKYVNVRRLLIFLEESIDEGTQFVVFEPNSPALWQKITRTVRAFLTNVWRDGALFGLTPEEAFYVKCDATTNPPEVVALGQVVTEIGVVIVKPAEFVIFRITQFTSLQAA
ncbi:MAG: phage tail sheath subtilisin-like domain-containing protein [Pyrinomonadaceae bacterium]